MTWQIGRRTVLRTARLAVTSTAAGLAMAACSHEGATSPTSPAASPKSDAPTAPASITQPASGVVMTPGYAATIARTAYLWGWPLVNMLNRNAAITQAPHPGRLNGVLPAAPRGHLAMLSDYVEPDQTFIACPNQDVVYGLSYMSLDEEPVIVQVPDFGDRFWVYAFYDNRTDQFGELGKPYGSKPGFYLLAGPNWEGDNPHGVQAVVRCPTALAAGIPRVFMDDTPEDRAAIQPVINQINIYPLTEFNGQMKTVEWAKLPSLPAPPSADGSETTWVVPEKFFDQLGAALDSVGPLSGEEALYGQFRALLDAAKSDQMKKVLIDAALAIETEVIAPFLQWVHNGVPVGNNWNRSINNAAYGFDYFNRTATAKSNMFENRANETQYFYTDRDSGGGALHGNRSYRVSFPAGQEPQVRGFWSLTLYNDKHFFHPNPLKRYSLGTKSKTLKRDPDGSLTLYVGSRSPGGDNEPNWLPAPDEPFSLYIRAYWGKQGILDGSWKPPAVEPV